MKAINLLYGLRLDRGLIDRSRGLASQPALRNLFNGDLPLPANWHLASSVETRSLIGPVVDFTLRSPADQLIHGQFLQINQRPILALDYHLHYLHNEKTLFNYWAGRACDSRTTAYLNIKPGQGQRMTFLPDGKKMEDFISRYPLGWRVRSANIVDLANERQALQALAKSPVLDKQSRYLFQQCHSLQDLLNRRGGERAIIMFTNNHPLHLKRPLSDLI